MKTCFRPKFGGWKPEWLSPRSLPVALCLKIAGCGADEQFAFWLCCSQVFSPAYPLTAWRSRSDGKAVRTSTVWRRMRRRAHSTRSSPPLAMKAGIHSTLPPRLWRRCRKRCFHSSLTRSWKARWTTDGFMVTKFVCRPTSWEYSSTGARLHLNTKLIQV